MPLLKQRCCCFELTTWTAGIGLCWVAGSLYYIISFQTSDNGYKLLDYFRLSMVIGYLLSSFLLLLGVTTNNQKMALPWIVVQIIDLVITNIIFIYILCVDAYHPLDFFEVIFAVAILDLIVPGCLVIVWSFYDGLMKTFSYGDGDAVHVI